MYPLLNMISPTPPTRTEIVILIILSVVSVVLLHAVTYAKLKLRNGKTRNEILRLEMAILKSTIIYTLRFALLSLVIFLPLIGVGISASLSVVSAVIFEDSLLGGINIEIVFPFLSLLVSIILMQYFLDKYGAIYKLPLMYFVRDDIRQFLKKHIDIYAVLLIGFTIYVVIIIALLEVLVDTPLILPKEIAGMVVIFLLVEVLPNKKYENAINLCKRFTNT